MAKRRSPETSVSRNAPERGAMRMVSDDQSRDYAGEEAEQRGDDSDVDDPDAPGLDDEERDRRIVAEAKERFRLVNEAEGEQRKRELEDQRFSRGLHCGRGYYRVLTTFANDQDFDLDIVIARIENQAAVYGDPFGHDPSGKDWGWAFITDDIPRTEYLRGPWRESKLAEMLSDGDMDWTSVNDQQPFWVQPNSVRVAEYFRATTSMRERLFVPHRAKPKLYESKWADDPAFTADPDLLAYTRKLDGVRSRKVEQRKIEWYLLNGTEILDREAWPGRYIPIVQVLLRQASVA